MQALTVPPVPIVSLTKGIEVRTGMSVSQILHDILPKNPVAVVSGPSLAVEVKQKRPTAVVAASLDDELAKLVQEILHQKLLRVYRSQDMVGVEIGGSLKNIYAIAGGVCDGLRMGENAMAGLLTRCLAEMVRIGIALGAKKETLFGLSGLGDLMLTAYSGQSRNHRVGGALAAGKELNQVLEDLDGVAEGVPTAAAVYQWVGSHGIKAPVLTEVYRVLYEKKKPVDAFNDLVLRQVEEE
jgi:glycerol-3-phosphate dehydrogenase (NAD(P)+)